MTPSDTVSELLASLTLFLILLWLGCLAIRMSRRDHEQLRWEVALFGWAFAIRFSCSLVIYAFGLVEIVGDEDASGWLRGVDLQQRWYREGVALWELPGALAEAFQTQNRGYFYLLGAMFYLTDAPSRLAAAALNGFFGALTVLLAYRVARTLFSPWVAGVVGRWTCFMPSLIIWSAQTIKEPVIIFLETAALYGCIRLQQRGLSLRHLVLCVAAIICMLPFRFYAAFIMGVAVLLALLLRSVVHRGSRVAAVSLLAVTLPLVLGTGIFARHTAQFERFDLNRVEHFRRSASTGGAEAGAGSGVRTADVRSTGGLIRGMTVGAAHLLLAPFPWQLRGASMRMLLTLPELLFWWWLFFKGVIPGVRLVTRSRLADVGPILLFLLGFGLLYSLMFGNVGLVFRQRAQLLPWLLIFGAVGLEQRVAYRRQPQLLRSAGGLNLEVRR